MRIDVVGLAFSSSLTVLRGITVALSSCDIWSTPFRLVIPPCVDPLGHLGPSARCALRDSFNRASRTGLHHFASR